MLTLIERMGCQSANDIDHYLLGLPENKLSVELTQSDANGKTPLHLAIEKADFEMVKVFLSFDAPTSAKIKNKSTEDYAKELIGENPKEERQRIYALIKSRGRWQSSASKEQGIVFSRSMKTIETAVEKIHGAVGKTGVLLFGITGEGKSTFINYLLGIDYKIQKVKGIKRVVPTNGQEQAAVGNSTSSATLYPQLIHLQGIPYVLIDLPGFEDTRGTAEEICAAASICMLTRELKNIQAIPLICSWPVMEEARMLSYRKAAYNIGAIISQNPQAAENVILILTKPNQDTEEDDVRARLQSLTEDEKWVGEIPLLKREEVNDDMWRNHCLRLTTQAILSRKGNIVIADVTSPNARESFKQVLQTLANKTKNSGDFDFVNYSRFMKQFQIVIEGMIVHYNRLMREQKVQDEALKHIQGRIAETTKEEKSQEHAIAENEEQKKKPFTEESFQKKIEGERNKLKDLRNRFKEKKEKLQTSEFQLQRNKAKLEGIEKEGEKLIDIVHRNWVCEKTEEIKKTKVDYLEKINVPGYGMLQFVDIKEETIPGKEKTVAEHISYPSQIPINRFIDRSYGGHFVVKDFSPGAMQISGVFNSTPGMQGGVGLSVELYGNLKDFPDTKDRINQQELALKTAEMELAAEKKDLILEEDIEVVVEKLKALEIEKALAIGDHKRTQEICEMQIRFIKSQLETTRAKLIELAKEAEARKEELNDLKLQLQVNEDLFAKLKKMILVMEFKGEAIGQFISFS